MENRVHNCGGNAGKINAINSIFLCGILRKYCLSIYVIGFIITIT